jgi:hypothetical protein
MKKKFDGISIHLNQAPKLAPSAKANSSLHNDKALHVNNDKEVEDRNA